jgi:hypothetical protein
MADNKQNLCKDCIHFVDDDYGSGMFGICKRPNQKINIDNVTGNEIPHFASIQRDKRYVALGKCGPEGIFYEHKKMTEEEERRSLKEVLSGLQIPSFIDGCVKEGPTMEKTFKEWNFYNYHAMLKAVGVSSEKLNEVISKGYYPCGPDVKPGGRRSFSENDLIALSLFSRLIDKTLPSFQRMDMAHAARIATEVKEQLDLHPYEDEIVLAVDWNGAITSGPASNQKPIDSYALSDIFRRTFINISGIRELVRKKLKRNSSSDHGNSATI